MRGFVYLMKMRAVNYSSSFVMTRIKKNTRLKANSSILVGRQLSLTGHLGFTQHPLGKS